MGRVSLLKRDCCFHKESAGPFLDNNGAARLLYLNDNNTTIMLCKHAGILSLEALFCDCFLLQTKNECCTHSPILFYGEGRGED
uniref:Uncharacterized protein n=1 Tax=Pyxicephalus adspersus TaxID=30357 RepID=A0AAV3APZ9_PYXAD|nr:TPA: hypothetical protein GDO54_011286 [Pyxicephalus adspersus]